MIPLFFSVLVFCAFPTGECSAERLGPFQTQEECMIIASGRMKLKEAELAGQPETKGYLFVTPCGYIEKFGTQGSSRKWAA